MNIIKILKFDNTKENIELLNWLESKENYNEFIIELLTKEMNMESNLKITPKNKKQQLRSLMKGDFWD